MAYLQSIEASAKDLLFIYFLQSGGVRYRKLEVGDDKDISHLVCAFLQNANSLGKHLFTISSTTVAMFQKVINLSPVTRFGKVYGL